MEWLPGNKEYRPCRQVQHRVVFRRRRPGQHRLRVRYLDPPLSRKSKILSRHKKTALPMRKTAGHLLFYVGSRVKPCQNFVNRHAAFRKRYGGRLTHAHAVPIADVANVNASFSYVTVKLALRKPSASRTCTPVIFTPQTVSFSTYPVSKY